MDDGEETESYEKYKSTDGYDYKDNIAIEEIMKRKDHLIKNPFGL